MLQTSNEAFKTEIIKMADGRRAAIEFDSATNFPATGDNVWLVTKRFPRRSVETLLDHIAMLLILRSWAEKERVPLVFRFRSETFLSGLRDNRPHPRHSVLTEASQRDAKLPRSSVIRSGDPGTIA